MRGRDARTGLSDGQLQALAGTRFTVHWVDATGSTNDDLRAAANMEIVRHLPGGWEELTGNRRGQFSCRLDKKLRLVIRPSRQPPPLKPDGGLDWSAIDAITVTEVVNYHD